MIGKTISHYRILEKIGEGGMGEVYLAQDTELHRKAALKFIAAQYHSDPEFKIRFKREAQAAAALNHANIITIYDFGEFEDRSYIVMEYLEGGSLKDLISAQGLAVEQALHLTMQICAGLSKAHEEGTVHRDIKPANILLNNSGQVKIGDFGLALLQGGTGITRTGTTIGTPNYMSPEQARGEKLDWRSDIFSTGVVFYELLTGHVPFTGDNYMVVLYAIVHQEPPPLQTYRPGISPGLQKIIDHALCKEIKNRYQGIGEFLADLNKESRDMAGPNAKTTALMPDKAPCATGSPLLQRRFWQIGAAAVLALIMVLAMMRFRAERSHETPSATVAATLMISTSPAGAAVFLNHDSVGVTPVELATVSPGRISLRLSKPGFLSVDTSALVIEGQTTVVSLSLQPAASIVLTAHPPEAQIFVDGKLLAREHRADLQLPIGLHDLMISAPGYQTKQDRINLVAGANPGRNYALEMDSRPPAFTTSTPVATGTLNIFSEPAGAAIFVEGQEVGKTPQTVQVQAGARQIAISLPGYEEYTQSLNIEKDRTVALTARLNAKQGMVSILVKPYGTIYIDHKMEKEQSSVRYAKKLPPGLHVIKAEHPSWGKWEKSIEIESGGETLIEVDFNKQAALRITSFDDMGAPLWATIFVDGKSINQHTPKRITLRIGQHTIEVRREGYEVLEKPKTILLESDWDQALRFTLKKQI